MAEVSSRLIERDLADGVREYFVEVTSSGAGDVALPFTLDDFVLPDVRFGPDAEIAWWTSDWGAEWQPQSASAAAGVDISITAGRSSKGAHPFAIVSDADSAVIVAVAWSGNWRLSLRTDADGRLHVTGGLDRPIAHSMASGGSAATPSIITSRGWDWNVASAALIAAMRQEHGPSKPRLSEWNTWWPYEDAEINEQVFLANAAVAAKAGLDVAVMDAGWFGPDGSHWHDVRGDWDQVNTVKFPSGLEGLADQTRALGIGFGIWLEPEAIGHSAWLNQTRPELVARTAAGESLGYVCLGSPAGREFVAGTVQNLLTTTGAIWLKWDFNIDPGAGCQRTDHGHGAEDGLYAHVTSLYEVLDQLRAEFPNTVFENCSSGGLRWDLGIAAHLDVGFASDPDWPEHTLSCLWASSLFFPPEQLLAWCDSQWRGDHPHQNLKAASLTQSQVDMVAVASMLAGFGVSQRLVEWPAALQSRLQQLLAAYEKSIRPVLSESRLVRLSGQPEREGGGERRLLFQLQTPVGPDVLFAFNLADTGWLMDEPVSDDSAVDVVNAAAARVTDGRLQLQVPAGGVAVVALK